VATNGDHNLVATVGHFWGARARNCGHCKVQDARHPTVATNGGHCWTPPLECNGGHQTVATNGGHCSTFFCRDPGQGVLDSGHRVTNAGH
jgi:hypothetical protein